MNQIIVRVDEFLKSYGMHYESIDIEKEISIFIEEMNRGLKGEPSTLKMLCTYLSSEGQIPIGEPVIVIDAGGTNFRVAVVSFDKNKKPVIEDFKLHPMPGTQGQLSKEEFFKTIAGYLEPVIGKSNKIGFCFSYPTEILPNKDGKLIGFNKEVRVSGMQGQEIGANLLHALKAIGYEADKRIVLLNDTVATLLGGKAAYPDRRFDSYIGFILGTGTNTCYLEGNREIVKAKLLAREQGVTMINIESGGYGKIPRGTLDQKFDSTTADPGSQQFEKMIAGAYQGRLVLEVIKKAAEDGLLSKQCTERVHAIKELITKEVNDFCLYPYSDSNVLARCASSDSAEGERDRKTLYFIIDALLERAAKLVAVNLAAVMLKTGKGKNPCFPVCVTVEGTTFYKSKLFRGKLDYYVKTCLNDKLGIYSDFAKAENATLVGTAIAGLLN